MNIASRTIFGGVLTTLAWGTAAQAAPCKQSCEASEVCSPTGTCVSKCNPTCGASELCSPDGACVSKCNPACGVGVTCTAAGSCEGPATATTPPAPVVAPPAELPRKRSNGAGVALTITGASLFVLGWVGNATGTLIFCAIDGKCDAPTIPIAFLPLAGPAINAVRNEDAKGAVIGTAIFTTTLQVGGLATMFTGVALLASGRRDTASSRFLVVPTSSAHGGGVQLGGAF